MLTPAAAREALDRVIQYATNFMNEYDIANGNEWTVLNMLRELDISFIPEDILLAEVERRGFTLARQGP